MTFAWYGHLKLQEMKVISSNTPLYVVILLSWGIALAEYSCQVPANRIGFSGNGGSFSLMQLKVIQECITPCNIYRLYRGLFPGREPSLEPLRCLCLPGGGGILRVYEVIDVYFDSSLRYASGSSSVVFAC